ncbi:MAG: type-F conjugative transfer system secretin TraK, partial [Deltaproteobacteria bacterium]|nr:type-F conjugative transfer system secretin TraK [Deltaproteobacteria bacterium]
DIPDVFSIDVPSEEAVFPEVRFSSVDLRLRRIVKAEGEGLVLKEYRVMPKEDIEVREIDFMSLAERPAAVALDSTVMKRGLEYRLFVIDQASGLR